MTRETKVGLVVGLGVILLIGIIVSDHLAVVQQQEPASFARPVAADRDHPRSRGNGPTRTPSRMESTQRQPSQPTQTPHILPPSSPATVPPAATTPTHQGQATPPRIIPPSAQPVAPAPLVPRSSPPSQEFRLASETKRPIPMLGQTNATPAKDTTPTGISPSAAAAATEPPQRLRVDASDSSQQVIHYVLPGQSLWEIAEQYYDNGDRWRTIAQANPESIGQDGQIRTGVRLVIPHKVTRDAASQSTPTRAAKRDDGLSMTARIENPDHVIVVKPGDSLIQLAQEYLGSGARWKALYEANRDQIDQPDQLNSGIRLRLPDRSVAPVSSDKDKAAHTPAKKPTGRTYTVRANDTLSSIAQQKLGDRRRWRDIYRANRDQLGSPDDIWVGQELNLPAR